MMFTLVLLLVLHWSPHTGDALQCQQCRTEETHDCNTHARYVECEEVPDTQIECINVTLWDQSRDHIEFELDCVNIGEEHTEEIICLNYQSDNIEFNVTCKFSQPLSPTTTTTPTTTVETVTSSTTQPSTKITSTKPSTNNTTSSSSNPASRTTSTNPGRNSTNSSSLTTPSSSDPNLTTLSTKPASITTSTKRPTPPSSSSTIWSTIPINGSVSHQGISQFPLSCLISFLFYFMSKLMF